MVVSLYMYIDSIMKDLLLDITFRSFLVQETAGNKRREFTDLVPFPLPISREDPRSLVPAMGRKIDRLIGTDHRGGVDLNGILKPT